MAAVVVEATEAQTPGKAVEKRSSERIIFVFSARFEKIVMYFRKKTHAQEEMTIFEKKQKKKRVFFEDGDCSEQKTFW